MGITAILALICIVLGVVGAVIEEQIVMPTLAWFVLAIAFNTLTVDYQLGRKP